MKTYSLAELATYLQRVVAMNFQEPVWVRAEILQAKENRGHIYLDLIQKDIHAEGITAQASAALWSKNKNLIVRKIGHSLDQFLREGVEVSLLVDITYHAIYGLTLSIQDLDPAYTLGRLQLNKQQTIEKLRQENLMELNKKIPLPDVIQRIAVLSAPTAAGYQDFVKQLADNEYGYDFSITLFPNAMQGLRVRPELLANLTAITEQISKFDCVVMIRGGGAKIDLSAFDQYDIAKGIAELALPVLSGIGHETDSSVVDLVSHKSFKTPTAVAAFLIEKNLSFESQILSLLNQIEKSVQMSMGRAQEKLANIRIKLLSLPQHLLQSEFHRLVQITQRLHASHRLRLEREFNLLKEINVLIRTLDPRNILERGYVLSLQNGKAIKRAEDADVNIILETVFADGVLESRIQTKHLK